MFVPIYLPDDFKNSYWSKYSPQKNYMKNEKYLKSQSGYFLATTIHKEKKYDLNAGIF